MASIDRLRADGARLGYGNCIVPSCLDLAILDAEFTTVVGSDDCGKSTLLKALVRLLKSTAGRVIPDSHDTHDRPTGQVARRIGILPQSSMVPDGIIVSELVTRDGFPHRGFARRWTLRDEELVVRTMDEANVIALAIRWVGGLSGG